jgi:uncharacterized membrane protein YphA (DoxX/SURF4 family)
VTEKQHLTDSFIRSIQTTMDTALWVVQILLALTFLFSGGMKLFQPLDELQKMMKWVATMKPPILVRIIGSLEILGAGGLVLPALTGIFPILTPIAAVGLVLTMVGAMTLHLRRKDAAGHIIANFVLLVLAAFIAYGRFVAVPLA